MKTGLKSFWREAGLTVAGLLLLSLPFWLTDLDLTISHRFYHPDRGWFLAKTQPWLFLYRYGGWLFVTAAIGGGLWHALALRRDGRPAWRLELLAVVLALILGPSFLCNSVFKEHWGRPRPSEIKAFGGKADYHPLWVKGRDTEAKSFPSGHAAAGFALLVLHPLLRRRRPGPARALLGLGLASGLLMGLTRIVQGRHFASDVLWSAGFVYLAALFCHHVLLGLTTPGSPPRGSLRALAASVLVLALAVGGLLASPYADSRVDRVPKREASTNLVLTVYCAAGDIELLPAAPGAAPLSVAADWRGHGWPGSRVAVTLDVTAEGDATRVDYAARRRGLFLNLGGTTQVALVPGAPARIVLQAPRGAVRVQTNAVRTAWESVVVRESETPK
ncbi:MAG: phosphatase PAP2 family protein [Kiritimatiellae bacterium]|nr:phosphatase PAP2 family protein [Kiritimatiellia bacterium]